MNNLLKALDYRKDELDTYIKLLSAPLLLTIYWYYGGANRLGKYAPTEALSDFYGHLFQFAAFFILTLIIPLVYIKFIRGENLRAYGLGLGDKKYGFRFVLTAVPLLIAPLMYISAGMADIQAEYPLAKILHSRPDLIFYYELAYIIFYYIAWEFFFRGFLLFGLKDKLGAMNAVLIQTISSCLIHLGKPDGEILGSIFVGILFGAIALRTRSIWYVFILHAALGVLTDLFVIWRY